jgi:PAS domain S-box-containing protein
LIANISAPRTFPLVVALLALVVAIGSLGAWLFERDLARIRAEKIEALESIARLKADQITWWRQGRLQDAGFGAQAPHLIDALMRSGAGRVAAETRAATEARLGSYREVYGYDAGFLVAPDGTVAFAAGSTSRQLEPVELAALPAARRSGRAVMSRFFLLEGEGPRISVAAPVQERGVTLGYVVLRSDPERLLFPMLRRWPSPSPTAETLLVTRDGDELLYITGLRHDSTPPMAARIPLSNDAIVGVRAVKLGRNVTLEGADYRGVDVIVRIEWIPGTDWILGTKVDRNEILAEARARGAAIVGFALLGILLSGVAVFVLYNRRQNALYRDLYESGQQLRTSEARLRGVVDATPDLIAALDSDYRFITFNKPYAAEFERIFGRVIAPGDSIVERLAHLPDELANARELWARALAGEQYTIVREFGDCGRERKAFELVFGPIRDAGGRVIGAVHTLRDVSARLRTERDLAESESRLRTLNDELEWLVAERTQELVAARDQAETSNRVKDIFLATMSHELRTPLNSIIGFSDVLLSGIAGDINDEQRTQLAIINRSGQQLLGLIGDVLDISKIESGKLTLRPVPLVLTDLLLEQQRVFELQAAERGLEVRFEYPAAPVHVLADAHRVRQVIGNLLSNALKFTDRGGVGLIAEVDGNRVRITVYDSGIGIAAEDQPRLFRAFQRISPTTGRIREGTGLGLAISRRLVEAMGGEIGVTSEPGIGSRFWFTLPLA